MKRPKINIWMMVLLSVGLLINLWVEAWCIRDAFFAPAELLEQHADNLRGFYLWNLRILILSSVSLLAFCAALPMLIMKKRSTWVWYLIMGLYLSNLVLIFWRGMPSFPALALNIALIWFWYSKDNRRWYRVLYTKD